MVACASNLSPLLPAIGQSRSLTFEEVEQRIQAGPFTGKRLHAYGLSGKLTISTNASSARGAGGEAGGRAAVPRRDLRMDPELSSGGEEDHWNGAVRCTLGMGLTVAVGVVQPLYLFWNRYLRKKGDPWPLHPCTCLSCVAPSLALSLPWPCPCPGPCPCLGLAERKNCQLRSSQSAPPCPGGSIRSHTSISAAPSPPASQRCGGVQKVHAGASSHPEPTDPGWRGCEHRLRHRVVLPCMSLGSLTPCSRAMRRAIRHPQARWPCCFGQALTQGF